ncbi:MAG: SEC-C metal-binding domain-containing protein [Gaiellales bacterium]
MDAGWNHWLPTALQDILGALDASETRRRRAFEALAAGSDPLALMEWERFRMVAPSRLDVPALPSDLDAEEAISLLEGLGLAAGEPPRRVAHPDPVETVLTLEHEDVRELERLRAAIEPGAIETAVESLPDLDAPFGGTKDGRNDPCPCGSGRKFKKCHGA